MPRRFYACAALFDIIVSTVTSSKNGAIVHSVRLTARNREDRSISNSYGMFPACARKNMLNKSIHVFIRKKHHLILKPYFDISDEIIMIIIRNKIDIIILCLETISFFSIYL